MPKGHKSANPRKPKPSDVTAKYRKRLKRRIDKLEKLSGTAGARRNALMQQMQEYNDLLKQTYTSNPVERKQLFDELEKRVPAKSPRRARRSDKAFTRRRAEMNRIEKPGDTIRNKVFWQATKDLWRGAPRNERVDIIKRAYGTDTLQEAYDIVMEQHRKAITEMESMLAAYRKGELADTEGISADVEDPYNVIAPLLVFIRG